MFLTILQMTTVQIRVIFKDGVAIYKEKDRPQKVIFGINVIIGIRSFA
jgi:hypothetical protein